MPRYVHCNLRNGFSQAVHVSDETLLADMQPRRQHQQHDLCLKHNKAAAALIGARPGIHLYVCAKADRR